MTAKEKQGFGLYFLFAFGMAWLCQVGGCMALLQQNNAVLYQLALIVTMFCPLLAVLLVQKAFLRQPTGIGWKVQGKRRFWLAAWFGPAVFTLLGAVLYFAVFPSRLDFSGSWLVAAYGGEMDAQTLRSELGVSTLSYLLQNAALGGLSSRTVALLQCTCPVMTAAFSYFLLGERLSTAGLVGAGIILACVVVETKMKEPE